MMPPHPRSDGRAAKMERARRRARTTAPEQGGAVVERFWLSNSSTTGRLVAARSRRGGRGVGVAARFRSLAAHEGWWWLARAHCPPMSHSALSK